MPKIEVELSVELNDRLGEFVARSRGVLYCQKADVIAEAVEEYLERHERKVRRANA